MMRLAGRVMGMTSTWWGWQARDEVARIQRWSVKMRWGRAIWLKKNECCDHLVEGEWQDSGRRRKMLMLLLSAPRAHIMDIFPSSIVVWGYGHEV